jgi:hypothetical protein
MDFSRASVLTDALDGKIDFDEALWVLSHYESDRPLTL